MAKKRKPAQPEVPWGDQTKEIVEAGIGQGFAAWEHVGVSLRGRLLHRWRAKTMRSPAVTFELTEAPTVPIYNTEGDGEPEPMTCVPGDKVNVSLSYDLDRKLTRDLEGEEIGVFYAGDQPTPKGSMRVFRVFVFGQSDLPF